jgi:TetR/AcrR family transcriptional regulator
VTPLPSTDELLTGAARTRERLLEATHDLLTERAGGEVSLSEVCARAGANVAMVRYCFGNKDGLFDALLERVVAALIADLDALDRQELEPDEKLRLHIRGVLRSYVRYPYLNRLVTARFIAGHEPAVSRVSALFAVPTRDWYARLLAEGQAKDVFREVDPTFFFFSLLGAAEFMFSARPWMERAFGERIDERLLDRFVEHTTDFVLAGIAR